jgi:hypothetical protein
MCHISFAIPLSGLADSTAAAIDHRHTAQRRAADQDAALELLRLDKAHLTRECDSLAAQVHSFH